MAPCSSIDARFVVRAEIVREKGTNRGGFFRGAVDKYPMGGRRLELPSLGDPRRISGRSAGGVLEDIQRQRAAVWHTYHASLREWAADAGVTQPTVPARCRQPAHLYYLLLPDLRHRDGMLRHLAGVSG